MNDKLSCKDHEPKSKHGKLQHLLIPHSKWFGMIKGEYCILCHKFFADSSYKFWRKNDN